MKKIIKVIVFLSSFLTITTAIFILCKDNDSVFNQEHIEKSSENISFLNWETYENFKCGYKIKYPNNYYQIEDNSGLVLKLYNYENQDNYFELSRSGEISNTEIDTIEEFKNDIDKAYKDRFILLEEFSTDSIEAIILIDKKLENKNNKVIYFKSPYKQENYNQWLMFSFSEDIEIAKQILSTLKFNFIVEDTDVTKYIPKYNDSNPYTTYISEIKIENIDNDIDNEILLLIDYNNNYISFTHQIILLDKNNFSEYEYKSLKSINYFQDVYGFNNRYYRTQKTAEFTGKIKINLNFIDIDNDNTKEIIYTERNDLDSFTGLNIIKYYKNTNSFESIFHEFGSELNIKSLEDLDGDNVPEIIVYKEILEDEIINNKENAELFELYKPRFENQYVLKNKAKEENKITFLKWFDIYKWNGEKYIIDNIEFSDLYKDFLQKSTLIAEKSEYDNIEINNRRNEILGYYTDEIFTAQNGDGLTHIARKAIEKHMEKFYNNNDLKQNQKIYAEDYLKLKYLKEYNNILVGDKISFSVKTIDEAIMEAKHY